METFKAFGVEAKMVQQTVDRAQEMAMHEQRLVNAVAAAGEQL
jgi:hypothetical protein